MKVLRNKILRIIIRWQIFIKYMIIVKEKQGIDFFSHLKTVISASFVKINDLFIITEQGELLFWNNKTPLFSKK